MSHQILVGGVGAKSAFCWKRGWVSACVVLSALVCGVIGCRSATSPPVSLPVRIAIPLQPSSVLMLVVIASIVENAAESIERKPGTVRIRLHYMAGDEIPKRHRFPVNFSPGDTPYACIEIEDEGSGIPDEDISRLFDPFFSTKFTGRGLGLAVALGRVRSHNGCITVTTVPGAGSCFRIWLPLHAIESS